ncbi:MAG: polysaccharide pyruvyl transferase family protein [Mesorhizobium sp.]
MKKIYELQSELLRIPDLYDDLSYYGAPSPGLLSGIQYNTQPGWKTFEVGLSSVGFHLARLQASVRAFGPTETAANAVQAIAGEGEGLDLYEPVGGDIPSLLAQEPVGAYKLGVISVQPTFPAYFAAAYHAMRLLAPRGKLVVRGGGALPIDEFVKFLRSDPAWDGFEQLSEDSIATVKVGRVENIPWNSQPYIVMNSVRTDARTTKITRTASQSHSVRYYSTVGRKLSESKQEARSWPTARTISGAARVGLVGFYGFGNYGDELFRLAFDQALPDVELTPLHDLTRRPYFVGDKASKVDACDAVLIGGGDLIIPQYWTDFYFEPELLRKPVFIHGVGCPKWMGSDPSVVGRLKRFFQDENVKYINVRDQESADWIRHNLNPKVDVDVSPDIVFGMELEPSPPKALTPIFGIITRQLPKTVSGYENLVALCDKAKQLGYKVRQIVAACGATADEDLAHCRQHPLPTDELLVFSDIEGVNRSISECAALASMKFHGCVAGIAMGIPTISLITTDKFNNLYAALDLTDMATHFLKPEIVSLLDRPLRAPPVEVIEQLRIDSRGAMNRLRERLALLQ